MLTLPITRHLLTHPTSRPAMRDKMGYRLREVRAVVMHWTANTDRGAHALANRNYFNLGLRPASAHYVVDDRSIVQCLPDNEVGFHVGAKRYLPEGKALMEGGKLNPNFYTLGIEMCVNKDGNWEETYKNSVELAAFLILKHRPPAGKLLRHFDITGKDCPKMMLEETPWKEFNTHVAICMIDLDRGIMRRAASLAEGLNVRKGPGMEYPVMHQMYAGEPCLVNDESGNWSRIDTGGWVFTQFLSTVPPLYE